MEKTITEVRPAICEYGIGKFKTFNIGIVKVDGEEKYECYSFTAKSPTLADVLPIYVNAEISFSQDEIDTIKTECEQVTRSELVSSLVRSRYSADDIEAIILNQGDGDESHEAEYTALQEWRKNVKAIARQFLDNDD